MAKIEFSKIIKCSKTIGANYHLLEKQYHGNEWTIEEDALAFLTGADWTTYNVSS